MNTLYKDDIIEYYFLEDVLIGRFLAELTITEEMAKHAIEQRIRHTAGKSYRFIAIYPRKVSLSPKATKVFSSPIGKQGLLAAAVVTPHKTSRYLANFFLKNFVPKNELQTRAFADFDSAYKWVSTVKLNM